MYYDDKTKRRPITKSVIGFSKNILKSFFIYFL